MLSLNRKHYKKNVFFNFFFCLNLKVFSYKAGNFYKLHLSFIDYIICTKTNRTLTKALF